MAKVLAFAVAIYVALGVFVFCAQRSMLYFPSVCTAERVDFEAQKFGLKRWLGPDGKPMGLKQADLGRLAQGTVMIMYGNGGSAVGCVHYVSDIGYLAGFNVFILEYPGYQDRAGRPTEESIFEAADAAFRLLPTNAPIYLVGESLGSGVAS